MDADLHFRLWRAIRNYVIACGGDPARNVGGRQRATVEIELALDKIEKATRAPDSKCPFLLIGNRLDLMHGPAQAPHTCPYRTEIKDDSKTLCTCCEACIAECHGET